ncbi:MAG: thioredoxin family protein [Maritimibacter sp.]|nr:thioredoxin family protein [Maritimibacter sp.]
MHRRTLLAALPIALVAPRLALAVTEVPYVPGLIDQRLDAGETLFVDFFAPWCGTCQVQRRVINALTEANPAYEQNLTFVEVDWDTYGRSELGMVLKIPRRSTLVAIGPDRREIGRIVAGTAEAEIKALLDAALAVATGTA